MFFVVRLVVLTLVFSPFAVFAQETAEIVPVEDVAESVPVEPQADDAASSGSDSSKIDVDSGADPETESFVSRRSFALLVCGHPGDTERLKGFAASMTKVHKGLVENYSVPADNISVVFGEGAEGFESLAETETEEAGEEDVSLPKWLTTAPAASAENLKAAVDDLNTRITANDNLWMIVMGHSNHDRGRTWFNLPGLDVQQNQFAEMFRELKSKQQVFVITIPASGYFVRPMSQLNRLVITATEPGLEINETLFPHALADVMSKPLPELADADEDKVVSMFDFYMAVVTDVATRYADENLLSTEHAVLDDNGDRRGTELQVHFLEEKLGGLRTARQRKTIRKGRDGYRSSTLILSRELADRTEVSPETPDAN